MYFFSLFRFFPESVAVAQIDRQIWTSHLNKLAIHQKSEKQSFVTKQHNFNYSFHLYFLGQATLIPIILECNF